MALYFNFFLFGFILSSSREQIYTHPWKHTSNIYMDPNTHLGRYISQQTNYQFYNNTLITKFRKNMFSLVWLGFLVQNI